MPELVLGVVGARVRGVERQEFLELGDGQHQRFRRCPHRVGVADAELGVRAQRALRVGLGDLLEELARRQPLLVRRALPFPVSNRNWSGCAVPGGTAPRGRPRRSAALPMSSATSATSATTQRANAAVIITGCRSATVFGGEARPRGRRRGETQIGARQRAYRRRCAACRPSAPPRVTMTGWRPVTRPIMSSTSLTETRDPPPILYTRPGTPRRRGRTFAVDRVVHEREVAGLLAVAEDADRARPRAVARRNLWKPMSGRCRGP